MTVRALLIGCGEPAIHAETESFAESLGVEHLERVLMPGGCWWLAEAASATSGRFRRALLGEHVPVRDALVRFIAHSRIERVVLLAHEGCDWYRHQHPGATEGARLKIAGEDIFTARDELRHIDNSGVQIEGRVYVRSGSHAGWRDLF